MVRKNFSRLLKHCIFVLFAAALVQNAFAQQHGKAFSITTSNATYSATEHSFVDGDASSGVRLVFVAPGRGVHLIIFDGTNGDYYISKCPDDTYTSCVDLYEVDSSWPYFADTIYAKSGDSVFYRARAYGSSFYSSTFDVRDSVFTSYSVKIKGIKTLDTSVIKGTGIFLSTVGMMAAGEAFVNWNLDSGTGSFDDPTLSNALFRPTSDATISLVTKKFTIKKLTDKDSIYTYSKDGIQQNSTTYQVPTSYTTSTAGCFVLYAKTDYNHYIYSYGEDGSFSGSYGSRSCGYSDTCKYTFCLAAGETGYFGLAQTSKSNWGDDVSARVVKTAKVNADTTGAGYVYVGGSSLNYDSLHVAGDTISLRATPYTGSKFGHWEKVSGKCTILDSTQMLTSLAINGDCKVKAVFVEGSVYSITTKVTDYSTAANSFSQQASSGVRFKFVAPDDGSYAVNFKIKDTTTFLIYHYNSTFSSYSSYQTFKSALSDSLYLHKNDTLFYLLYPVATRDSLKVFSVNYSTLKTYKVTLTSASEKCSTSVKTDVVAEGSVVTYYGYSVAGYRPNGFKVTSGTASFLDSLPNSARIKVKSDIDLKLQCKAANLIEITTKEKYRSADKDFYDVDASSGLRYYYIAPGSSPYIIRAKTKYANGSYFNGYYYLYSDSTFTTSLRSLSIGNSYPVRNFIVLPSKGDTLYFATRPSGSAYYDDSIAVFALNASIVDVEGKSYRDTVAVGDSLAISVVLDTGYRFVNWKISYGSGKFTDSTMRSSYFLPSSDSAKVVVNKVKGQVYTLTNKFVGYTYYANGSQANVYYGVKTVYPPKDTGLHVLVMQSASPWIYYVYLRDSLFYSYYTYGSINYSANPGAKNEIRYTFNATSADSSWYFLLSAYQDMYMKDSIWAKVVKTSKIRSDMVGSGYVYIAGNSYAYDSTHIVGDTVQIIANAGPGQRFDHWDMATGTCTIIDSTERVTKLVIKGDCKVRAFFRDGILYPVTSVPTSYTTAKDYYLGNPSDGVKFKFIAPTTNTYAIVTSWAHSNSLQYYRYPDSTFSSYSFYRTGSTTVDTLTMNAGDSVFINVRASSYLDSLVPFWISYSTTKAVLELTADSNGTVSPARYDPAWKDAKYNISALANVGYRFDAWEVVSGSSKPDDSNSRITLVTVKNSTKLNARFRKSVVQKLTKKKKTFNYINHYYSDRTGSAVYFTWTPPDTSWYMLQIQSSTKLAARWYDFRTDTTFLSSSGVYPINPIGISDTSVIFMFHSTAGEPLYWALIDSITSRIPDHAFTIQISDPYVLRVSSDGKGRVVPSGDVGLYPGADTSVYAVSYGGYKFDKWVKVSGKMDVSDSTSTKTRVKPLIESCEIKATYVVDLSTEPMVEITDLDLSNYPGICASVMVKDKNTDKTIVGLDSTDFVLAQDKKGQPIHITSVKDIGGVSVAIVVDESGSMSGTRMVQAKESIRKFINEMSGVDRTAIVGFTGSDAFVRQAMTSDKSLLLAATDRLDATGGTNIRDGTYKGLQQVVGETNPTAVIVFSDGSDGGNRVTTQDVIDYAKSLNTVVHSVAVGSDIKTPLKDMADGTGGTYTYAPTADQLASIYTTIRNSVQAKYTICYETPDSTINGDTHMVTVKAKFLNKTASDTAYWDENFMPPVVKLTKNTKKLIGVKQPAGDFLNIKVYVTSRDSIASVVMYMRIASPNAGATYTAYTMTHVKDSLWQYVIPGSSVIAPGIDFYVIATDASGLVGKTPRVPTPSNEPYTIPVDNKAPAIEFMSVSCVDTTEGGGEMTFTIKDDDGISSSKIYYRNVGSVVFTEKKMTRVTKKGDDWSVSIPNSVFNVDEVEFYVRAIDKKGVSARWETFENNTIKACRDSSAIASDVSDTIKIVNGEKEDSSITRLTDAIALTLVTEDFTSKRDTVTVSLSCLVSGDVESNIQMVETSGGHFATNKNIEKNEYGVKKEDGKISCSATDTLVATYKDPLYGTFAYDSVAIGDTISIAYQFMDEKCKTDLDSVQTSTSTKFCLKVQAVSPSLYVADTLKLTLFTDQGDSISVEAIETDDYSSEYTYKGSFSFVEDSASLKDSLLDAVLDLDTTFNRVVIQGGVSSDKSKLKKRDSLVVFTNYVAADIAEMYDSNLDGKADSIRIHFKKPLKKKVASIDTVFWNEAQGTWTSVDSKKIHITEDSSWAEARVRKAFKYGLTSLDTSNAPYVRVTKTKEEFSQKVMLVDRVGAVPVKAVKHPGQISMEEYLEASDDVAPDTLVITMSESIKNTGKKSAWKDLFRYSKTCEDTVDNPIRTNQDPVVDSAGRIWKFVLADYAIMKGYCVTTNPKATYVDNEGNSMGRGGVEIEGRDETVYLYEVSAPQPVHGIGKKGKWIPKGGDSWEEIPDSLSVIKVASVAPYEATIHIYDNLANVVTTMKQKFGYNGEMEEKIRGNEKNRAKIGFLVWNHRSNKERKVGTGVYIWRIDFKFKDGHTEYRILKTGYLRRDE